MYTDRYHLTIPLRTKVFNLFRSFFILTKFDNVIARLVRHRPPGSLPAKLTPPNYLYKPGTVRNFTINGINYSLDLSDTVGHSNYFAIADAGHEVLYSMVKPGMNIIDIGANVGSTTLNFARLTGKKGNVYSFEPDTINHSRAAKNIALNNFSNIRLYNLGLGCQKETANQYNVNETNRGMLRILVNEPAKENFSKTTIQIDTLDNVASERNFLPAALIKIDVEGYELNVLKGAENILRSQKPVLFIELDDENLKEHGASASELVSFLTDRGYHVVNAADRSELSNSSDFTSCHIDIIATPKVQ